MYGNMFYPFVSNKKYRETIYPGQKNMYWDKCTEVEQKRTSTNSNNSSDKNSQIFQEAERIAVHNGSNSEQ
jgi:hypothetical protein